MSGADLAVTWPAVQPRVSAVLLARGLQGADVDDIVQEVAVRALRNDRSFSSDDHFVRWCCRVAINLHVDTARRQRKLTAHPPEDLPSREDTARTAEQRMDLATLAAGISALPADEQRLLLDPAPTESRREAVRLAVRRHRIRARLVSLIEGVVIGVPVLRRILRSLSTPAKVGVAAVPVVLVTAGILVGPSLDGHANGRPAPEPHPYAADAPSSSRPAELIESTKSAAASAPAPASGARQTAARAAGTTSTSGPRTIAHVDTPVVPVAVTKEQRPDDQPTLCMGGDVNLCVDRPGPTIPHPELPLL